MKLNIELTKAQYRQLVISLRNDWMDNDARSKTIIERILEKIGSKA